MEGNQTIDKPKIYQALGIISGILELTEGGQSSVLIGEQTYFVTFSPKVREKHQPGQLQNFKIYPAMREKELGFRLRIVTQTTPRESGIILKGCWEIHEEEPRLVIYRNFRTRCTGITILPLIWEEAPVADGKYWEIEAKLKGDKFEVVQAIGPFKPPQKYQKQVKKTYENAKSDLPPPILRGDRYTNAKSELPPPILKSVRALIEPIYSNASQAIEETTVAAKAVEVSEPIAVGEIKVITPASKESIEPEETEASPVVVEPVIPKKKKAVSKSPASKKSSKSPETAEPKKTKEKVKSSRSKKSMSLAADGSAGVKVDRLFLGKQLPPGK
jgi:hypothetical protein